MGSQILAMKAAKIREWCANNNIFCLKADIQIPEVVIDEAQKIYDMGLFTPHRVSHGRGWSSATLHGEEWNITHYNPDAKPHYKWTELTEYAPVMTDWLQNTFPNNGKYSRCRFMLLESGGFIRSHTDTHEWKEGMPLKNDILSAINIAITQPENCYLRRTEDKYEVPFKPRDVFWFNNGPFHEAANFSREPRIHFIVHGGGDINRTKLFCDSFDKEYPDADL
jgi:hypothetical protein